MKKRGGMACVPPDTSDETMAKLRGDKDAFGRPGIEPRWTHGCKEGVGTAYSGDSGVWVHDLERLHHGTLLPDDRQTTGSRSAVPCDRWTSAFHEEKRNLKALTERSSSHPLAYRITNTNPHGCYRIVKEVLAAPHLHMCAPAHVTRPVSR
jgi:glucoamylase